MIPSVRVFARHAALVRAMLLAACAVFSAPVALAATQVLTIDPTFSVTVDAPITAVAALPGGRVLIGGEFQAVNGTARRALARLNVDGSFDATFAPSLNDTVTALAVLPDGRILVAGRFFNVGGSSRGRLVRLNADGSLDTGFDAGDAPVGVRQITALSGGRVLVVGDFSSFNGVTRLRLARLLASGAVDPSFVPFGSAGSPVGLTDVVPLADDRVLYGADGSILSGSANPVIFARLMADGRTDPTFASLPVSLNSGGVRSIAPLADGRFIVGGSFATYLGSARDRLARVNADGALDAGFAPVTGSSVNVERVVAASDGKIYVFRPTSDPARFVTRLTATGAVDTEFAGGFSATPAPLNALVLLDGGEFLIPGSGFEDGASTRTGLIRTRLVTGPVFATQPASRTIVAGNSLTLSGAIAGAENPTYQWFKDGVAIEGAQRPTLTLTGAQAADAGAYRLRVTHTGGTIDSAAAVLTVTPSAPVFGVAGATTAAGLGPVVRTGTRFALQTPSLAAGSTPLSYQWFRDGQPLTGETGAVLYRAAWSEADSGRYHVVVRNALGEITSLPVYQGTAATPAWEWLAPAPQGANPLTGVHGVNGIFFATGRHGTILRSRDGVGWTAHPLPTSATITAIGFGNGHYVALATTGGLWVSADGALWLPVESGLTDARSFTQIAFGDGRFVAVGNAGAAATSRDGSSWTAVTIPTTESLIAVAHGDGRWVALSSRAQVFTSSDAINWTAGPTLPEPVAFLAYGAGNFVIQATTTATAYRSRDGRTWTSHPYVSTNASSRVGLQYHANLGFVSGLATSAGRFLTSPDGASWTERSSLGGLSSVPTSLATNGSILVITAGAAEPLLWAFPESHPWIRSVAGDPRTLRGIASSGTRLVAVSGTAAGLGGGTSAAAYASSDGVTWTTASFPVAQSFNDIAHGGAAANLFVAVGTAGAIVTSPDGASWTSRTSGTGNALRGARFLNGRFLVAGDGGTLLTSSDGLAWRSVTTGSTQALQQIAFGDGVYVAVGAAGTVLTSPDAAQWTARTSGTTAAFADVIFAAGKFIAVTAGGELLTSPNGTVWTRRLADIGSFTAVVPAGGRIFALAGIGGGFASSDGETWTPFQNGCALALNDAVEFNARLIAVGASGAILAHPLDAGAGAAGAPARLANLSVGTTLTAGQQLTLGLTVAGGTRELLVRAAGPALAALGVAGALPDPRLEVIQGATRVAENDDWPATLAPTFAALGAFPFPAGSKDAALLRALQGSTSVLAGGNAAGRLVVEAYDTGAAGAGRLINLSTRHRVSGGSGTLIAGMFVGGTGRARVLIRGVGPGLAALGVPGVLADPRLELFDAAGQKIAENDDWTAALAAVFPTVGAFSLPAGSRDSALVAEVSAGAVYTVQLSGAASTAGEALIEIYELP